MGKGGANKEVYALITMSKDRFLGGNPMALYAKDEEEQKSLTTALSKALRGNVVHLPTGDYLIFSAD